MLVKCQDGTEINSRGENEISVEKKSIKRIADHYGYEPQSRQLIEEMAELTVAINKLWRSDTEDNKKHVFDEIADVEIMLKQIIYLLECRDQVNEVKKYKIDRQIKRIEQEESQWIN